MIYIQSNREKIMPHHFDCACALYGAIECGLEYNLVSFEEVEAGKFDNLIKRNLFVGSVEFMREVFKRIGISDVRVPRNSDRDCQIITLKEAHEIAREKRIFIKSYDIKLFTGLILDGVIHSCLNDLPEDTKVMAYEPFEEEIESEWRVYVKDHKMIDSRNYSGDFTINPDYDYVENVIKNNSIITTNYTGDYSIKPDYNYIQNIKKNSRTTFPMAYTIDVGIFESGKNEVIEYNDMWAIGNYGIPNDLYIRALRERYFEIVRSVNLLEDN